MLSKCLNPQCNATFRYLWEGRLFRVDFAEAVRRKSALAGRMPLLCTREREHPIEHFWLCGICATSMTVELSAAGEVRLVATETGARKPMEAEPPMSKLVAHAS